jgi:hypothetical protein
MAEGWGEEYVMSEVHVIRLGIGIQLEFRGTFPMPGMLT